MHRCDESVCPQKTGGRRVEASLLHDPPGCTVEVQRRDHSVLLVAVLHTGFTRVLFRVGATQTDKFVSFFKLILLSVVVVVEHRG